MVNSFGSLGDTVSVAVLILPLSCKGSHNVYNYLLYVNSEHALFQ